jgi:hypothetical protein
MKPLPAGWIPALTLYPGWAWAVIHGPKTIENRTWRTQYRGPLAIHAGAARHPKEDDRAREILTTLGCAPPADFPCGVVLGIVRLTGCDLYDPSNPGLFPDWVANPFAEGPWCLLLADPIALSEPIPAKGRQGLWPFPQSFPLCSPCLRGEFPPSLPFSPLPG